MKMYTVRVRVPNQDLDVEVLALDEPAARRLLADRLDGIEHDVKWVQS